jgi:uncharacterized protein (TIGR02145 family)
MKVRFLPFLLLPILGMAQANSNGEVPLGGNTYSEKQPFEIKRNALFNLEEIKVRWKKAALENCTGVPCSAITAPGAPTGVVATVGNGSVSVAFVAPTNNGGRAITGYTVTSNPATSPVPGTTSPIIVTGLTNGTSYTFTVIATNEVGNSVSSSTSTAVTPAFTCGTSTISDVDNNVYETVSFGNQCWTKQNLKVSRYNDNSPIDLDASGGANGFTVPQTWSTRTSGAYTIYANESSTGTNATNYGFLYNWFAAAGIITNMGSPTKNICPTGWHVPTDGEWTIMIQTLDPSQLVNSGNISTYNGSQSALAGGEMKSTSTLWDIASSPSPGTNTSGFSALPGGQRTSNGSFGLKGSFTLFWSTTGLNPPNAWYRTLQNSNPEVTRANGDKLAGASIRCLKD